MSFYSVLFLLIIFNIKLDYICIYLLLNPWNWFWLNFLSFWFGSLLIFGGSLMWLLFVAATSTPLALGRVCVGTLNVTRSLCLPWFCCFLPLWSRLVVFSHCTRLTSLCRSQSASGSSWTPADCEPDTAQGSWPQLSVSMAIIKEPPLTSSEARQDTLVRDRYEQYFGKGVNSTLETTDKPKSNAFWEELVGLFSQIISDCSATGGRQGNVTCETWNLGPDSCSFVLHVSAFQIF